MEGENVFCRKKDPHDDEATREGEYRKPAIFMVVMKTTAVSGSSPLLGDKARREHYVLDTLV